MHYQEKLDAIFAKGNIWKHRTLRTVFDIYSSEYEDTSVEEKLEILRTIQSSGLELDSLLLQYKNVLYKRRKTTRCRWSRRGIAAIASAYFVTKKDKSPKSSAQLKYIF